MRVLQINAVYEKFSTGRTTKELHEAMLANGIESFVASPELASLNENCYLIGNRFDHKVHAVCSRIFGKQGYYSKRATKKLLDYIDTIKPDIIHLRNLHSNYINLPDLLSYIAKKQIATVITLHDSWFYTGKCVYYIEVNCEKWRNECGNCPALKMGNTSLLFDKSREMLLDKKRLFESIEKLAIVGVSQWVAKDASESILQNASIIKCIYNWIDLDKFKPRDTFQYRNSLGLEGKKVVLGIAMIWNQVKGITLFHKLADLLPDDYQILLVGDDSKIKEKHCKVMYLGTISDVSTLSLLYSMADVFVNPTIQETFGKTTAEAMASGTPIIAYNGTATPELVGTDEKCGFLIDDNKPEAYRDKILEVVNCKNNNYGDNARKRAEVLFSKDKNIQEYFDIYKSLLQK